MAVKCDKECGYSSPKDMECCPRCGKDFDKKKDEKAEKGSEPSKNQPKDQPLEHSEYANTLPKASIDPENEKAKPDQKEKEPYYKEHISPYQNPKKK